MTSKLAGPSLYYTDSETHYVPKPGLCWVSTEVGSHSLQYECHQTSVAMRGMGVVWNTANENFEKQMSLTTQLPQECNTPTQGNPRVLKCMAAHLLVIH